MLAASLTSTLNTSSNPLFVTIKHVCRHCHLSPGGNQAHFPGLPCARTCSGHLRTSEGPTLRESTGCWEDWQVPVCWDSSSLGPVPNGGRPVGSERRENCHSGTVMDGGYLEWECRAKLGLFLYQLHLENGPVGESFVSGPLMITYKPSREKQFLGLSWGWAPYWRDADSGLFLSTYYVVRMGSRCFTH